jgi:hypothetical protein
MKGLKWEVDNAVSITKVEYVSLLFRYVTGIPSWLIEVAGARNIIFNQNLRSPGKSWFTLRIKK